MAAAWAPAALGASIGSYGAAAIIGFSVIAALAAILGGFPGEGGTVKGAAVLLKTRCGFVSPGEGVVTKEAMDFYGGSTWLDQVNTRSL